MALPRSQLDQGATLGAHRLISLIGEGGMGEVWLAEHVLLGRRAAIKLLRPTISANPEMVSRFFNEARAAAAISDPGIVQIFDFGHHTDGTAYIVMELLVGETLDHRLRRTTVMPIGDALRSMRQVASSLGAAHERGIIHRDLKPENIFLVRDPEVPGGERAKLLDFGIAKLIGDPFAHETQTAQVIGTPMFMSPEQCRGGAKIDQRSDVYSLGCVLFTLLIGRPPFSGSGSGEVIAKHLTEPAPRASSCADGIPAQLDDLIARCLAKQPADRYDNANELAAAIGSVLGTGAAVAAHVVPGMPAPALALTELPEGFSPTIVDPANTTLSSSVASVPSIASPRRLDRRIVAAAAGLVVILAMVGVWTALREPASVSTSAPGETPTPTIKAAPAPAPAPAPEDPLVHESTAATTPLPAAQPTPPTRATPRPATVTPRGKFDGVELDSDGIPTKR